MSGNVTITVPSYDQHITYTPTDGWDVIGQMGSTDGQSEFFIGSEADYYRKNDALITFVFPQPATGLEYWAFQRLDAGNFTICFDCPPNSTVGGAFVDALNKSTNGGEPPRLLYSRYDLSYAVHNLTISNAVDTRSNLSANGTTGEGEVAGYGQLNLDRFVLLAPAVPPTSYVVVSSIASTAIMTAYLTSSSSPSSSSIPTTLHHTNAGDIAGGVIGGAAALALIALLTICLLRRQRRRRPASHQVQDMGAEREDDKDSHSMTDVSHVVPFILGQTERETTPREPVTASKQRPTVPGTQLPSGPSSSTLDPSHTPARVSTPTTTSTSAATTNALPRKRGLDSDSPVSMNNTPTSRASRPSPFAIMHPGGREGDAVWLAGEPEEDTLPPDYETATARRRELARGRGS